MPENRGDSVARPPQPQEGYSFPNTRELLYEMISMASNAWSRSYMIANPEHSPTPKYREGQILVFNIIDSDIKIHLEENKRLENPIFKIVSLEGNGVNRLWWFGDSEDCNGGYSFDDLNKYCKLANPIEIEIFESAYRSLNLLTKSPLPGSVVRYKGIDLNLKNKKAVIVAQYSDNRVILKWLNGRYIGQESTYKWNILSQNSNQSEGLDFDEDEYCTCESCNSLRPLQRIEVGLSPLFINIDNKIFCDGRCANQAGYYKCNICCIWHSECKDTSHGKICPTCIMVKFRSCTDCGRYHLINDMVSYGEEIICRTCRKIDGTLIHSYSYKPLPLYNKMPWENTRYLGIELEVETEGSVSNLVGTVDTFLKKNKSDKKLHKMVYYKTDGSLRNGIEIVFHPFTLSALHKFFPSKDVLEFLYKQGARSLTNCGMHIHVSKKKLSKEQLLKGKWFFYKCRKFLEIISERNGNFDFCRFESELPSQDPYYQPMGRRSALNMAGSPETIELRFFKSTLDYRKFMVNLQFADCFVDYIQHSVSSQYFKSWEGRKLWLHFLDYANKSNQWQLMSKYVIENKIV